LTIQLPRTTHFDLILHGGLLLEQFLHLVFCKWFAQAGVDVVEPIEQGAGRGDRFFDIARHIFICVKHWLLRQISGGEPIGKPRFAFKLFIEPGHNS